VKVFLGENRKKKEKKNGFRLLTLKRRIVDCRAVRECHGGANNKKMILSRQLFQGT